MTDFDDVARRYIAVFNETDGAARQERIAGLFAPDTRYTDPLADVSGHDGIDGFVGATQQQFPGFGFRLHGSVDAHHDQARFRWAAGPAEELDGPGEPPFVGFDVVVLADDGRIARVHGFIDVAPAA